jgi:hypothetical protein
MWKQVLCPFRKPKKCTFNSALRISSKILLLLFAFIIALQSCSPGAGQKNLEARADSLYIRVRCIQTLSGSVEQVLLAPSLKKLTYRIEYINETYPDTISKADAEKLVQLKSMYEHYTRLIGTSRELQQRSALQLLQVSKLGAELAQRRSENMDECINYENRCADTLHAVLDSLIKRSVEMGCKIRQFN